MPSGLLRKSRELRSKPGTAAELLEIRLPAKRKGTENSVPQYSVTSNNGDDGDDDDDDDGTDHQAAVSVPEEEEEDTGDRASRPPEGIREACDDDAWEVVAAEAEADNIPPDGSHDDEAEAAVRPEPCRKQQG